MISHSRPTITQDEINEVKKILESEMIAKGVKVRQLEDKLCEYIGGIKSVFTCSGRSALVLALWTLNIKEGDEVIIPTYVCHSVMEAIEFCGGKPVIVDVDDNYCIDVDEVERNITNRTKAVVAVHIFGILMNIDKLKNLLKDYGEVYIIEDCAQAIGGELNNKKVGSFGDLSIFSFQATKMITSGEGGAVVLNNIDLLRNFEKTVSSKSSFFKASDIHAALALIQLSKLERFISIRRELAKKYISELSHFDFIEIPVTDTARSVFFRFPIRVKKKFDFNFLRKYLEERGICIRKGVDKMLHQIRTDFKCPNADRIFSETISLPIYPQLKTDDIEKICRVLVEVLSNE